MPSIEPSPVFFFFFFFFFFFLTIAPPRPISRRRTWFIRRGAWPHLLPQLRPVVLHRVAWLETGCSMIMSADWLEEARRHPRRAIPDRAARPRPRGRETPASGRGALTPPFGPEVIIEQVRFQMSVSGSVSKPRSRRRPSGRPSAPVDPMGGASLFPGLPLCAVGRDQTTPAGESPGRQSWWQRSRTGR